jgi:alkylhydroperoxidase family enzyme
MKIEPLVKMNDVASNSSALLSGNIEPVPEFAHLLEWARLGSAHVRKNVACVDRHRQNLTTLVQTEKRLIELDHWRESLAFTETEKAALSLSEVLSSYESEKELSIQIFEDARRHFSTEEIVHLTLTILAVNDWIDLQAMSG